MTSSGIADGWKAVSFVAACVLTMGALSRRSARSSKSRAESIDAVFRSRRDSTLARFGALDSFQTAKGSTYEVLQAQPHMFGTEEDYGVDLIRVNAPTRRRKTLHAHHDPKDVGIKEPSQWTVYVRPEDALRIGWHVNEQGSQDCGVWVDGDYLRFVSRPEGRSWGITSEERRNPIPYGTYPMVGLAPIELWRPEEVIMGRTKNAVFKKFHAGNPIVTVVPPHRVLGD